MDSIERKKHITETTNKRGHVRNKLGANFSGWKRVNELAAIENRIERNLKIAIRNLKISATILLGVVIVILFTITRQIRSQPIIEPVPSMTTTELLEEILATNIIIYGELIAQRQVSMDLIPAREQGHMVTLAVSGLCGFYFPEGDAACSFVFPTETDEAIPATEMD